jgi:Zn-dependent protease
MGTVEGLVDFLRQAAVWAIPVLAAVILHEISHGVVALRLGDDTALRMGRLTLNPIPHIDPIGTVLLPGFLLFVGAPFLFGYARPVPVNFARLREPRRDMVLVSLAGPLTNIVLAIASALLLHRLTSTLEGMPAESASAFATGVLVPLAHVALSSVVINVVLAIFNLLPIPPLDGGRVLTGLLPLQYARTFAGIEPFGFLIVIALLMTDSLRVVLGAPVRWVLGLLL